MKKKIKIVFFIDSLCSGGAQRQLVSLAANIDKMKFEPTVIVYHELYHFKYILDAAEIPLVVINKNGKLDLKFLFKFYLFIRRKKPDILQSFLFMPNLWARLIGFFSGIPFIITSERNTDLSFLKFRSWLEKITYILSNQIIVNAKATKILLIEHIGIPERKISIIHNGIDTNLFSKQNQSSIQYLYKELNLNEKNFVITLPGRIAPQKNHQCLIKALARLNLHQTNTKVLFIGVEMLPDLSATLRKLITENNLDDNFLFLGQRKDIVEIYSISSVVVLPSLWEGFPNVLLEAMSTGIPVVSSNIADNANIVDHGENGFLFKTNSDIELSKHLHQLMEMSSIERKKMGAEGKAKIQQNYSLTNMVKNFESFYENLI